MLVEGAEELLGELSCCTVDETRADLGELAAYVRLDRVPQKGGFVTFGLEVYLRTPACETGYPVLNLPREEEYFVELRLSA